MPSPSSFSRNGARARRGIALPALACACVAFATAMWVIPSVAEAVPPSRLMVLVLAPYLTFDDLSPSATPALWDLAENGAVGAANARTADRKAPNAASGALTISASRWSSVEPGAAATAADVRALQTAQDGSLTRPAIGSLGSAIHEAGGRTTAVSISSAPRLDSSTPQRADELVAMDDDGRVDESIVGSVDAAVRSLKSPGGIRLMVLDVPALAVASESSETGSRQRAAHAEAVRELDRAIAALRTGTPDDATLMVISTATDKASYRDPDLGVALVEGPGFLGQLTSSSTHRIGLVTTLDVAPTVLAALGIDSPKTMVGTAMTSRPRTASVSGVLATLSAENASTGAVDWLREAWFIRGFVAFSLLAVALSLWALSSTPRRDRVLRASWILVLASASMPVAAWLMFLGDAHPGSARAAFGWFVVAEAVVMLGLLGVRRMAKSRHRAHGPTAGVLAAALGVATLTGFVILADQWSGDPVRTGLLSYSVRSGWRFYGMGNEGAVLVVGASLVAVGLAVEALRDTRWRMLSIRLGIPVIGAIVLATTAAPFAGANAGAAIWGVVAYTVAWVALNRVRMSPKTVAIASALVVAAVASIVVLDMSSGGGSTHLGRFAGGILSGDMQSTFELVSRKLANNIGYFFATPYTLLFLGLGGVFALMRRTSTSRLRASLEPLPALRAVLLGTFVGGLVALVTEDSSSVMPALLWFAAVMPTLLVALAATPAADASTPTL